MISKNHKKRIRSFALALPLGLAMLFVTAIPSGADEIQVAEASSIEFLGAGEALSPASLREQRAQGLSGSTAVDSKGGVAIILWDELKRPRTAHSPASSTGQSGINSSISASMN